MTPQGAWVRTLAAYRRMPSHTPATMSTPSTPHGPTLESEAAGADSLSTKADIASLLKAMSTMEQRLMGLFAEVRAKVEGLEDRVQALEANQDSEATLGIQLDLRMTEIEKREKALEMKLDDVENRERRNNIRVLNVPELSNEPPSAVPALLQKVIDELFQEEGGFKVDFDRAHRGANLGRRPRVIIARLHRYTDKQKILEKVRSRGHFLFQGQEIVFFPDLSLYTLDRRRECRPLTLWLRDKGVKYRWGFPFSLNFELEDTAYHLSYSHEIQEAISSLVTRDGGTALNTPKQDSQDRGGRGDHWQSPGGRRHRRVNARKCQKLNTPPAES